MQRKLSDARVRIEHEREARLVAQLTPRERTVTECLVQGFTIRQSAQRLHVSESTLRNHIANILAKLELRSHAQLVSFAIASEIAEPPNALALLDAARIRDLPRRGDRLRLEIADRTVRVADPSSV